MAALTLSWAKTNPTLAPIAAKLLALRRYVSRRFLLVQFNGNHLILAQVRLLQSSLDMTPVKLVTGLPDDALEKGTPTDPAAMADLLKDMITEENLVANRIIVLLPPEACITKKVSLPANLSRSEALELIRQPGSGVQLPFPIAQVDLDLLPLGPAGASPVDGGQDYFLVASQKLLIDRLNQMATDAGLDLFLISQGLFCYLGALGEDLAALGPGEAVMVVELLEGISQALVLTAAGPFRQMRLSPVRPFPAFVEGLADRKIPASMVGIDDNYFPLSDVDLRALSHDLDEAATSMASLATPLQLKTVYLCGPGSGHPGVDELLQEQVSCRVRLIRALQNPQLGTIDLPKGLAPQALGRMVGLAVSLLG
jgi:Tfp pilus assembly PilM family ATPase